VVSQSQPGMFNHNVVFFYEPAYTLMLVVGITVNDYGASHDSKTGEENNESVGSKCKSTPSLSRSRGALSRELQRLEHPRRMLKLAHQWNARVATTRTCHSLMA